MDRPLWSYGAAGQISCLVEQKPDDRTPLTNKRVGRQQQKDRRQRFDDEQSESKTSDIHGITSILDLFTCFRTVRVKHHISFDDNLIMYVGQHTFI